MVLVLLHARGAASSSKGQTISDLKTTIRVVEQKRTLHKKRIDYLLSSFNHFPKTEKSIESKRKRLWQRAGLRAILKEEIKEYALLLEEGEKLDSVLKTLLSSNGNWKSQGVIWSSPLPQSGKKSFGFYKQKRASGVRRDVEFNVKNGERVVSPLDGKVVFYDFVSGLGNVLIVEAKHVYSVLYPLVVEHLNTGDSVVKGQNIGKTTGTQMHWEIRGNNGGFVFPLDPNIK